MRTTVAADALGTGVRYGLGLMSRPLSCGGVAWGHGGAIPGYETFGGATEDGRTVSLSVTAFPGKGGASEHGDQAVDAVLCR